MKCDKCRCINVEVRKYYDFNLCKSCLKKITIKKCKVCNKKFPGIHSQKYCDINCLKLFIKLRKIK